MMPTSRTLLLASIVLGSVGAGARADVEYNRDIRPILTENCFQCHGPAAIKAGFRLDLRDEALKPAESKAMPIVPGKPMESALVKRIFSKDAEEVMPPANSHKTLKAEQKELLKKWITEG